MKRLLTILSFFLAFSLHADVVKCGSGWWVKYKQNFGMEKITLLMPNRPTVTHTSTLTMATSWDNQTCYTFTGYFPPIGNIDTVRMFQEMLNTMSTYPFSVLYHSVYENSCGNFVLEYTAQDSYRNYIIQSFTVVSPFNAYTLQCIHPLGAFERYVFFRDSFRILCECGY